MIKVIQNMELSVGGQQLVRIDHWTIDGGKVYGLTGETGSGKSTLGKWLADIEPQYWKVKREKSPGMQDCQIYATGHLPERNALGPPMYLLQDAYQIFNPYVSIRKHFRDIWKNHRSHSPFQSYEEILAVLQILGIKDPESLMKRRVDAISQGEAQRLAFVLGFIRPTALRIYDEVFSNVDEDSSRKMLEYLTSFCRRHGTAAVVISHDKALIREYVDTIFTIRNGALDQIDISSTHADKSPREHFELMIGVWDMSVPGFDPVGNTSSPLFSLPEFRIGKGESVGLSGTSGLGKTTLLRGFLGEHPLFWSRCTIFGKEINTKDVLSDHLDIRYLPQSVVSAFNPVFNLRTSLREIKTVRHTSDQEVLDLMNAFGLAPGYLDRFPDELSGGEIQRMGIVSILMGNPDFLLLDESFASVDEETRDILWQQIAMLQKEHGFALLVVSHDTDWLERAMDRTYLVSGPEIG